ncbi:MAG: hypothetical protein PHO27_02200 [Sulfuricurvum sp.]|nr:hypothetical protein [Sulfuricurvum sp.]
MREESITNLLERIQHETGIVLSRVSDRDRIGRYLDRGGEIPSNSSPLSSELINLITTNETYFERESHHFDYLMGKILPELENNSSSKPIRILSAPCSSGEEVYTIALRILSYPLKCSRAIEIIGVDISEEMIGKAKSGIYSPRSVHALNPEILEKYFTNEGENYRINPLNGITIRFICGNVFDPYLWGELGEFDVIFSRNMMIYFDSIKNRSLLERFRDHLKGYLILGHADEHMQAREVFTPVRSESGVIYCKN